MWLERAVSADRIEGLDMHMEYLQRDIEDLNDAGGGGLSIASVFPRPRTRPSLARRITWAEGFTRITITGNNIETARGKITILCGCFLPLVLLNHAPISIDGNYRVITVISSW